MKLILHARILHALLGHDRDRLPLGLFDLSNPLMPRERVMCSCGKSQLAPTVDAYFARAEQLGLIVLPKDVTPHDLQHEAVMAGLDEAAR